MATLKDGWHTIAGYTVYVESGKILRGIYTDGYSQQTTYPYRIDKTNGWNQAVGISVSAFRAGVYRGTVSMQ